MDKLLMRLFGLTPDQVAQYGVAIVALAVMAFQVALFIIQAKNNAKNDESRNALTKQSLDISQQLTSAVNEVRVGLALANEKNLEAMNNLTNTQHETMPFLQRLVQEVVANSQQTIEGIDANADRTIAALDKGRAEIIHDVDANLSLAVERSVTNQNRIHKETLGELNLTQRAITERLDQSGGSLASRLDKVLGQMLLMVTKEEYVEHKRELLTEMIAFKSAVARIEANQTRPLPPLPLSTEPGLSAPPSLVLTGGDSKGDLTPVDNPPFVIPGDSEVKS